MLELPTGTTLRSRYKIVKLLGKGGFGETYLAEDADIPINPKLKCVVKRLQPQAISSEIARLFQQEGEVLYKLGQQHDQIPKLSAYFKENDEFYLIQELIDGHDLSTEIMLGEQWQENDVVLLLQEILGILTFVHQQNIIHRDIKPANLMRRRTDGKIVLIDFGAVREVSAMQVNAQGQTSLTVGIGTPGYMPDEQANGRPKLCSDVYAVGMLGIQALTGLLPRQLPQDPNTGEIVWRHSVKVSDGLADVLNTMVKPHFSQRYRSAVEAKQALMTNVVPPELQITPPNQSQPSGEPITPSTPLRSTTSPTNPVTPIQSLISQTTHIPPTQSPALPIILVSNPDETDESNEEVNAIPQINRGLVISLIIMFLLGCGIAASQTPPVQQWLRQNMPQLFQEK